MTRTKLAILCTTAILLVYLYVTAPLPLEATSETPATISVETLFRLVAAENDAVRGLYTKEIVGAGKKVGLAFGEDWKQDGVSKGPLPALFLRESAMRLEQSSVELGLFLGSDYPISAANRFEGRQAEIFAGMRDNPEPVFFYDEGTQRHTAMFVDVAVAAACVSCHNEHKDTPKRDWQLGDIMGATTWTYPRDKVSAEEALQVLDELRRAFRGTYQYYVDKTRSFADCPKLGDAWPDCGELCLPETERFMEKQSDRVSGDSLALLLDSVAKP